MQPNLVGPSPSAIGRDLGPLDAIVASLGGGITWRSGSGMAGEGRAPGLHESHVSKVSGRIPPSVIVLAAAAINDMKSDMSERELRFMVAQLAELFGRL